MWHASVASMGIKNHDRRRLALRALDGVGIVTKQWEDDRPAAYHVRRRLTPHEQLLVGDVCDLRGLPEALTRFEAMRHVLPAFGLTLAQEEIARV